MLINGDITIFNLRLDKETRREVFIPTVIAGVSFYDVRGAAFAKSTGGGGVRNEELSFQIRIPITAGIQADRKYIPEMRYAALADTEAANYWTIQKGSYALFGTISDIGEWEFDTFSFRTGVITREKLEEMQALAEFCNDFITILEYADNTHRGSKAVQHWRIGGK